MKNFKNLLFFSIFILLSSCGKTIDMDDEKEYITRSRGVVTYKGTPFTGKLVEYYDGDKTKLHRTSTLQDGKWVGPKERYYENGQLREKQNYKDDMRDGTFLSYDEDGQLAEKRTYKDGKLDGPKEWYYENGQLREKDNYKDDMRDGTFLRYYENGQLDVKETYKDGKLDGPYESYEENGQLWSKSTYKDGILQDN
jgi:antitoxin component YwqK of YwqJK toxin-antitoxin module